MTKKESEFWTELRFVITNTGEFNAYCDWIEPKTYYLVPPNAIIESKVGFLTQKIKILDFVLKISNEWEGLVKIEWENFLPIELDSNRFHLSGGTLEIDLIY